MKSTAAGPDGVLPAGQEVEVPDELGTALMKMGYADPVKSAPEVAATAPPETTAKKPAPAKRRSRSRAKKEG